MRFRWPLVRRSTMEVALDAKNAHYNGLLGDRDHEIVRLRAELARLHVSLEFESQQRLEERKCHESAEAELNTAIDELESYRDRLQAEIARLREHFEVTVRAKDEAYERLVRERDGLTEALDCSREDSAWFANQFVSLGIRRPHDWAAPLPPWLSTVVTADMGGVRGGIDPGINLPADDPRVDLARPFGLTA